MSNYINDPNGTIGPYLQLFINPKTNHKYRQPRLAQQAAYTESVPNADSSLRILAIRNIDGQFLNVGRQRCKEAVSAIAAFAHRRTEAIAR